MPELRSTGSRNERATSLGGSSPPSSSSPSLMRRRLRLRLSALLVLFRALPVSSGAASSVSASFVERSFSLPFINAGGSISSSSHTVRKSVKVNEPLGVSLNSFNRLRNVVSAILTTCTISSTDRRKLFMRAARRRQAPHMPAGRRPLVIQSRSNRCTSRMASVATLCVSSPNSKSVAKREM